MKMEILAPVGSMESLNAAVAAGANAVYLGAKDFSARRNAGNFDDEQLKQAVDYCHLYNVKVYVTVNILVKQNELKDVATLIEKLNDVNVDGLIVQDLGVAKIIHENFPALPLHGSTQMSIQHPSALPFLKEHGFSRIVVAREMNKNELANFCTEAKKYDIEVEYFVHGALCMCVSGQCLLSAMIGQRSGNRGLCAQPCRLPFKVSGGTGNDLSLKDLSLFAYVNKLQEMGVTSLKIEGRMKRPEYVALATYECAQAVNNEEVDTKLLKDVFSRSGFTDGYFNNKLGKSMFGIRSKEDVEASKDSFNKIHEIYRNVKQVVPIEVKAQIFANQPITLNCQGVMVKGEVPLEATNKPTSQNDVKEALGKLGNTPYYLNKCEVELDENLFVRNSTLNNLRRDLVDKLNAKRLKRAKRASYPVDLNNEGNYQQLQKTYLRLANIEQCPKDLEKITGVIVPLNSQVDNISCEVIVEIPRWITSSEYLEASLEKMKQQGVKKVYANNLAAIMIAQKLKMDVMVGNFINITNNKSLAVLESLDVKQATMSVELTLKEIEGVNSNLSKGVITYGRLPLMLMRNCPLKNGRTCDKCDKKGYIADRLNTKFPIRCQNGFSELLNSTPIYLADKLSDVKNVDYQILYFTIESKEEVKQVIDDYLNQTKTIDNYTRGLYYRGVL